MNCQGIIDAYMIYGRVCRNCADWHIGTIGTECRLTNEGAGALHRCEKHSYHGERKESVLDTDLLVVNSLLKFLPRHLPPP